MHILDVMSNFFVIWTFQVFTVQKQLQTFKIVYIIYIIEFCNAITFILYYLTFLHRRADALNTRKDAVYSGRQPGKSWEYAYANRQNIRCPCSWYWQVNEGRETLQDAPKSGRRTPTLWEVVSCNCCISSTMNMNVIYAQMTLLFLTFLTFPCADRATLTMLNYSFWVYYLFYFLQFTTSFKIKNTLSSNICFMYFY